MFGQVYVTEESKRITIGLFGKDVPKTVPWRGKMGALATVGEYP